MARCSGHIGQLHITATSDFDQIAQHQLCFIVVLWRFVFGIEGETGRRGNDLDNPWIWIYLGWFLVEFYWSPE